MTILNLETCGLCRDGSVCIAEQLEALLASAAPDTEVRFPRGIYFLSRPVSVENKTGLTLRGEGAVLMTHFAPEGSPSENNDGFHFAGCRDITVTGFVCTTDHPVNCAGTVIAVDRESHTYDVRLDASFPCTGREHLGGTDTCDAEGMPDYVIETYDTITAHEETAPDGRPYTLYTGIPYTVIGDHIIRVQAPPHIDLSALRIGHPVLYRYIIYGNTVFAFRSCHRVTLSHIEIERCASMGAVVEPRSSDFTFEDFNIRIPENSPALYAANADGIHILGLSGALHMKDCHFSGLGDDALNIHSRAGEIESADAETGTIHCIWRGRQGEILPLPANWAEAGDRLCVYEKSTFLQKGMLTLGSFQADGTAQIVSAEGSYAPGDILANDSFFASVHLEGCTVRNTRARGFLLQSRNMLIENCRFSGMSLPGIIVSPDVRVWYEVGPSAHVEIRNCVFEKCGMNNSHANVGAIVFKACHDVGAADYPPGVHRDISIHDNVFQNCGGSGIYVSASRDVVIKGNRFASCCQNPVLQNVHQNRNIVLCSCENAVAEENE